MKNDEFSFFNQQLAAMVRDGIPLESALRRLCADMRQSPLRSELEKLEADLAKGMPLREAAAARQLPDLYRQMLEVGAQSNNLPAVLTMLADHYQRRHVVWTRLKGLMVYPVIVLIGSFLLSCFLAFVCEQARSLGGFSSFRSGSIYHFDCSTVIWLSPFLIGLAAAIICVAVAMPGVRCVLRWRLPAFREASLAQLASALALMLKSGVPLDKALGLMEQLERGTPAGMEISRWRERLASGRGNFSEMAEGGRIFPPLFVWTVAQSHEDLPAGFQRASEIYQARASYRTELLLYSALPCSVLASGHGDHLSNSARARRIYRVYERMLGDVGCEVIELHHETNCTVNMDSDIFFRAAATTLALVVWFAVCGGLLFLIHFLLTLPMRRAERARLFLDLLDTTIQQGQPLEETLISASQSGDPSLGVRFHLLAAWLEQNLRLSDALAKVPRFLPPQVTAMLMAGQKIGDLRKVLPACRQLLKDAVSQTRGAINYLVILTFVITPLGIWVFGVMEVIVVPRFREINEGTLGEGRQHHWN